MPPLPLLIRFTTSLPDLPLHIPTPTHTTTTHLKRLIRHALPPLSRSRLRLIHAGKVLSDGVLLSDHFATYLASAPPTNAVTAGDVIAASTSIKGKARAVEEDEERLVSAGAGEGGGERVYIHCSVGDELSDAELKREEELENTLPTTSPTQDPEPNTIPQPIGFDRLLSAGFTEADVAMLRAQFNRIHNTHLLDAAEVRQMEERWIDESAGQGGELADGTPQGAYEDLFWGVLTGFFWPVILIVGIREEGAWGKRRKIAIVLGLMMNLSFGALKIMS